MPVVIEEVLAQVEPEPTPRRDGEPNAPPREVGMEALRAQLAALARRAARLHAD